LLEIFPCLSKEKQFFYPTSFENLEAILKNNFTCQPNLEDAQANPSAFGGPQQEVKFYQRSDRANEAFQGSTNPRILIFSKVLTDVLKVLPENSKHPKHMPKTSAFGLPIDTIYSADKEMVYKFNANELYPDHVIVYRDLDGPGDGHTSRLTDFLRHCQVSYRAGTRYNPQEQQFKKGSEKGSQDSEDNIKKKKSSVEATEKQKLLSNNPPENPDEIRVVTVENRS